MSEPIYDDTDRRLMSALHDVDVPTDLQSRLQRSLQVAMQEQELLESQQITEARVVNRRSGSPLWSRRNVIAATVAAGLSGIVFGYRQLTQPLSQSQLVECTRNLLDQLQRAKWQLLTESQDVAVKASLHDIGFVRQVPNVSLKRVSNLLPPRHIQRATAYDLGGNLVLFDLNIERGVQRASLLLSKLEWSRSDVIAFAMSSEQRTLVLLGPPSIRNHILRGPTT